MKRTGSAVAVCSLILSVSLLPASYLKAQGAPSIQQLFAFACDSKTTVCANGENPDWLIQSADGNFYGTTFTGGTGNKAAGTVFEITPAGVLSTLFTFVADHNGNFPNGALPNSLVEGNDGFLYGTTNSGGANNIGVAFKLSKTGAMEILYNFCNTGCGDGATPSQLALGNDGNFYGSSFGVLFRVTPKGVFTVLHRFDSTTEGPTALGLTPASDKNIYGTALGAQTLLTTLFRLTPAGQFTILHTLHYSDFPTSAPLQGSDGKLHGATSRGVFSSSLNGVDYQELSIPDSFFFSQPISQASDGNLWDAIFSDTGAPAMASCVLFPRVARCSRQFCSMVRMGRGQTHRLCRPAMAGSSASPSQAGQSQRERWAMASSLCWTLASPRQGR
jgi:uncharacterized repeat protein (TIGR03803 family)